MDNETQVGMSEVAPLLIEIDPLEESAKVQQQTVMEMGGNQGGITRTE